MEKDDTVQTGRVSSAGRAARHRPITVDERSGALHPQNLRLYHARWFEPDPGIRAVVDQYWHVQWRLSDGESIDQRVIDLPAVTVTIEEGDVPAPLVVTGLHGRAWMRQITGAGSVFAIRLRPAGLAVLSELSPHQIADCTAPLTPQLDADLHALAAGIAAEKTVELRVRAADAAIRARMGERPPRPEHVLANAVLDELSSRVRSRTGASLAEGFGVSERTIQRALRATLGRGPKWISRRIRLQAVAQALASSSVRDLAALATDLGYADQAHLTADFRAVAGTTPGAYWRSISAVTRTVTGT